MPVEFKQEDWAYLGVNVNQGFEPVYIIPPKKAPQVRKLKAALKNAKDLYLATDEDREGEAISWHLCEVLKPKVPVHRLVFHEITEEAIRDALKQPRTIDQALVRAQEVRRIVDRLYGYDVSPLLWKKIRPRLSAGRVQSVAVRLIVERERQRIAFHAATYWDLVATFAKSGGADVRGLLVSVDGRRIPASRDFDPASGQLKDAGCLLLNEQQAAALADRLRARPPALPSWKTSPIRRSPIRLSPPARCSRRPTASTASPRGGRWMWPRVSTRTVTSPTCAPTRRTWPAWPLRRRGRLLPANTARSICPTARGSIRPRSRMPRRPTRRFVRRGIPSRCRRTCGTG